MKCPRCRKRGQFIGVVYPHAEREQWWECRRCGCLFREHDTYADRRKVRRRWWKKRPVSAAPPSSFEEAQPRPGQGDDNE